MKKILNIRGKRDGFGAQYHALMTGLCWARYNNYIYRHTPLRFLAPRHVGGNEIMSKPTTSHERVLFPSLSLSQIMAWRMNTFIGMKSDKDDNLSHAAFLEEPSIPEVRLAKNPEKYFTAGIKRELRNCYFSSPKPNPCSYDVAVHIRRGDLEPSRHITRYIPIESYMGVINKFKSSFPGCSIGIYSDGSASQLELLKGERVNFHLGGDIREAFHALVTAPNLVVSRSAFSFCAGIISSGVIYSFPPPVSFDEAPTDLYREFRPLKKWKNLALDMAG